ncbi:hypothetical protein ACJJIG_20165 [Microbulbifer sp. SSSA007]|uniref:hypothetical protein n=1 Tax=Microbulbifer sp. SSSA007 TaxID=3243379 RepID=UPI00403A232E
MTADAVNAFHSESGAANVSISVTVKNSEGGGYFSSEGRANLLVSKAMFCFIRDLFKNGLFLTSFWGVIIYSAYFFKRDLGGLGWIPLIVLILYWLYALGLFIKRWRRED